MRVIMDKKETENKIRMIIEKNCQLRVNIHDIDPNVNLEDYGVNSLSFVKLIIDIESIFNINIEEEFFNTEKLGTIESIIDYVENKTN
jgi:acyl carrier protein